MASGTRTLGVFALALTSCAELATQEDVDRSSEAIVGGGEAWLASAVAIKTSQCDPDGSNDLICSGILISPTTVLTAAHCVESPGASEHCPNGIDPTRWQTFRVAVDCHNVVTCPAGNWKLLASEPARATQGDVAVLRLAQPVAPKPTRLTVLARLSEIDAGDMVTLHGYGWPTQLGPASDVLKSIQEPISSIPLDRAGVPKSAYMFDTTSFQKPYAGTNHGDSGGPALVLRDGEWFTLGVILGGGYGSKGTDLGLVPGFASWILAQASDFPAQSWLPSAQVVATFN